jgi:catechol 2,3-dioxygenase-like lactoylglutathione lyase family enzyme
VGVNSLRGVEEGTLVAARPIGLCQIALSVRDLQRTHAWYRQVFGFLPAGGTRLFRGPLTSRVQGLPGVISTCWWLVDQQDFFQLEMFEFKRPEVKPLPPDWRPCDVGYSMVGFHVADFDAALARLEKAHIRHIAPPLGRNGTRRVCVRDPEGVLLEIMEHDPGEPGASHRPRPELPVATRFITVSVPDLERSRRFFVETLGLPEAKDVALHLPEHEALWGLPGARRRSSVLWAGDRLIELVEYIDPVGRPWPEGHRISDQGILNIALGFRDKKLFDAVYRRCVSAGYRGNWRPLNLGAWSVVYLNDDQGFSVELLFVRSWYDGRMGFRPKKG